MQGLPLLHNLVKFFKKSIMPEKVKWSTSTRLQRRAVIVLKDAGMRFRTLSKDPNLYTLYLPIEVIEL